MRSTSAPSAGSGGCRDESRRGAARAVERAPTVALGSGTRSE
jgi:hypothetical protein